VSGGNGGCGHERPWRASAHKNTLSGAVSPMRNPGYLAGRDRGLLLAGTRADGGDRLKVTCDTCGRTAVGTVDELIALGWSRAIVQAPFRRTFTACWCHQGDLMMDMLAAFAGVRELVQRRRNL